MTKWLVQKQTNRTAQKHAEHQDATDIQKKILCLCFVLNQNKTVLKIILKQLNGKILSVSICRSNYLLRQKYQHLR